MQKRQKNNYWNAQGVFFTHPSRGSSLNYTISGGNGLNFRDGHVFFWTSIQSTTWNTGVSRTWGRLITFDTPVSNDQYSVFSFCGHANDSREYPTYVFKGDTIKWNGETHVVGSRLYVSQNAHFKNNVHVHGGTDMTAAQLMLNDGNGTIPCPVHLSGKGPSGLGALHITGSYTWTLAGGLVLKDDTSIMHDNAPCGLIVSGPVSGPGRLSLGTGHFDVLAAGSNTGGFELLAANTVLNVSGVGTLGTGAVVAADDIAATLNFTNQYKVAVPELRVPGSTVTLADSRLNLSGGLSATTVSQSGLIDSSLHGDALFGQLSQKGTLRFTAATDGVSVGAGGAGSDFVFGAELNDGAQGERIGFVKTGANTVTRYRAGTGTGPTDVRAGTLKLTDDIRSLPELSWWLDASQESTLTRDADNRVVEWRSANGNGVTFTRSVFPDGTCTAPVCTTLDPDTALPCVSFSAAETNGLAANVRTAQRMVVLVLRPSERQSQWSNGVFGRLDSDYGQRYTDQHYWNRDAGAVSFNSATSARINGSNTTWNEICSNRLHIVVFTHDEVKNAASSSVTGNNRLDCEYFIPSLGGYFNPFGQAEAPRFFTGEICEAMAFGRILDENELRRLENELSAKWLNRTGLHANVPAFAPLAETADLRVASGAAIDLAGLSVRTAALSGGGEIRNTGTNDVTLTVDGTSTFSGTVGSGVALAMSGDSSLTSAGDLTVNGTLTVRVGPDGVINPIVVGGKLILGASARLVVVAEPDVRHVLKAGLRLVRAAGGVEGSFASIQVPRPAWKLSTDGEGVLLETNVGLAILVR